MPFDWIVILKTPAVWISKKVLGFMSSEHALRKASQQAMQGEDLARQGSLHRLVEIELEKLAASDKLPPGLQSDQFRSWLRQFDNVELFVEVLIARAGNIPEISKQAESQLAINYEQITQETRKLAPGRINLATSHVYGQLKATERGRIALQLSLEQWTAAQVYRLNHPEPRQLSSDAEPERVRTMSLDLLEAGKYSWKMPRFIAPLTLEMHLQQNDHKPHPTDASEILTMIEAGNSLVLYGTGGIGKTTLMLDLATSCLNSGHLIPLYVDVAVWARSNKDLFEYISSLPSAQKNGVSSSELAGLAAAGHIVIMLNGWNEMPSSSKLVCRDNLIQLTAVAKKLCLVTVSRTLSDTPNLPNVEQIEVRGLTWQGQSAVVSSELSNEKATILLDLLAKNTRLRHASRSPLILRGLIAQANKGSEVSSTVFDLLGAAVQAFEGDDQRHYVLSIPPVEGHQRIYLEELACLLTQRGVTNCSREDALQAIHSAVTRLTKCKLIGHPPELTAVFEVLVNNHLLHFDDDVVRFVHQRFQEYFTATRLHLECLEEIVPPTLLHKAALETTWFESLALVAGKLKGIEDHRNARVLLIKAAASIDLGLACDLVGICAFSNDDDPELHNHLITRVNELAESSLKEVRDLGIAYQIASGLTDFAERLWPLLESEDLQIRLNTYRLNGSAISLVQLGAETEDRVASWPPDRRVEFAHEIADNADNYAFLVSLARNEPDPAVRSAAISALLWYFPASDVPLQAWLDAPIEVQTNRDMMRYILYALDDGFPNDAILKKILSFNLYELPDDTQLLLAQTFPEEVGPRVLDIVFKRLRSCEHSRIEASLIAIANTHSPKRMLDLAIELVLQARIVPEWASEYLQKASASIRKDIFEKAWAILMEQDFKNLNVNVLGPLAELDQIERCVIMWLKYNEASRQTLTDIDRERYWLLRDLLTNVQGEGLINVVMKLGEDASYDETARLVDLVLKLVERDIEGAEMSTRWLPTVDEVQKLVSLFADMDETAEVPQDTIRVYLCSIASYVAPAKFGSFLLETCRRHLDSWSIYQENINKWLKRKTSPRPNNPQYGLYLSSSMARWGPDALPGLLELMAHPNSMKFLPEAIARIVGLPWASKSNRLFSSVSTDIEEGELRRKMGRNLKQPDDTYQHLTDEAAKTLGQNLYELVKGYQEKKASGEHWNAREAEYQVKGLAGVVANIPSAEVVDPVQLALASGLMDVYGTVSALRGLVRQGLYMSDTDVVAQLEALYDRTVSEERFDDSLRYTMMELSGLLFCVVPSSLLSKPMDHYLKQLRRFSHPSEIIRHLSTLKSDAAWSVLLTLCRELSGKKQMTVGLFSALINNLTPLHLDEFIELVTAGELFVWCSSEWTLGRLAPKIAAAVGKESDKIEAFLEACRLAQSPLSDTLAGRVLYHIEGTDGVRQSFLLEALDAGRAVNPNMPAFRMLRGMFSLKVPENESVYEVISKANNELRAQLYARAKGSGPIADGCRCLLASLESGRRETETGRPDNEPRHPAPEDGIAWTDVLIMEKLKNELKDLPEKVKPIEGHIK